MSFYVYELSVYVYKILQYIHNNSIINIDGIQLLKIIGTTLINLEKCINSKEYKDINFYIYLIYTKILNYRIDNDKFKFT